MPKTPFQRNNRIGGYKPSESALAVLRMIQDDYKIGYDNMTLPLPQFDNKSIFQEINAAQKGYNTYIGPKSDDPLHSWKSNTRRPIINNKVNGMIAMATRRLIFPNFFAQNPNGEQDREAARAMRLINKWIIENGDYQIQYINAVLQAAVEPMSYMRVGYEQALRKDRTKDPRNPVFVPDDRRSGFINQVVPCESVLIASLYEPDIEKQRFVIERKLISYQEAESLFSWHSDFKFVKPGYKATYNPDDQMFYYVQDENYSEMIEYVVYKNRYEDLELKVCGGVLMSEPYEPIKRLDKRYGIAKIGYSPINSGKFFYSRSLVNTLLKDEEVLNLLRSMVIDGSFIQLMPPHVVFGGEDAPANIMTPGTMVSFEDENSKIQNIAPRVDMNAGFNAMQEVERSIIETANDSLRARLSVGGERTAAEVNALVETARTQIGLFADFISYGVRQVGEMRLSDILQYGTSQMLTDLQTGEEALKFQSYSVFDDETRKNTRIQFSPEFFNSIDNKTAKQLSYEVLEKEGGLDSEERLLVANPAQLRDMKFKVTVAADAFETRSEALERAQNQEKFQLLMSVSQAMPQGGVQQLIRDFINNDIRDDADRYIPGSSQADIEGIFSRNQQPQESQVNTQGGISQQLTGTNSLKSLLSAE